MEQMKKSELAKIAKLLMIEGYEKMKKQELISAIRKEKVNVSGYVVISAKELKKI